MPILLIVLCYGTLILFGAWIANLVNGWLGQSGLLDSDALPTWLLILVVIAYVIATAIPFVPGAEIGLTLLMILGAKAAILIYIATILALALSFLVGRLVPEARLGQLFHWLGWRRSITLIGRMSTKPERIAYMGASAGFGWLPGLLRHRFLALIVLINLPGNSIIGGGGGIAMILGISRLMSVQAFVLCIAVAVCPIPLAVLLMASTGH